MRKSRIRAKLRQNLPALVTGLNLSDPSLFELASLMGFDGLWLDLEHNTRSLETASDLMRAARVGTSDLVVRTAKGEFMRIGRALEAGAQGIVYPRCDNAAEAAEVVKWSKFPPLGRRGFDGANADMPYLSMSPAQYLEEANEQTFLVVQVEDQQAIDRVDEIAAVTGVDVIMLGPGDFCSLSGLGGQFDHPRVEEATRSIALAAKRAGKCWGRPVASPEDARRFIEMGARFLTHGADILAVRSGWELIQQQFAPLGFTFDNRLS